ncbi:ABC transporter substrate-binding protein [Actinoplanes couchii]|uniref:ABC transporter substrate-binding protein n=1 Tax=Actinoplanes couchii TaxID=403638 RepID=UPI001941C4BE|nr:ABC transporter substrate-binding protein [Actinoplanes couchii]MDR6318024.1 ABC-type nitrate/sulfonate/bicarbonate transport system substrate-binding protein [Actinoplanes couchii]
MPALDEVWFTRCPVPTATGIAADRGTLAAEFAADGIAVRSFQDNRGGTNDERHFTHAHPALFREGGNVPALWARSRGGATRLIGLTWIEERQSIVVRAGSSISDPAHLRGLRLAVPRHDLSIDFWRAMALRGLSGALGIAGLTLADAVPVDIPAGGPGQWETELRALADGRVDAVYVKGAVAVEAAARHGLVTGIDLDGYTDPRTRINNGTPRPVTVAQSLLDEHPDIVDRFLAVLIDSADWAATNPDGVSRILATETGSGPAGVAGAYQQHGTLHLNLSPERLDLLADQERFLRSHGFLPSAVDVAAWADHEPLRRAHELVARRSLEN